MKQLLLKPLQLVSEHWGALIGSLLLTVLIFLPLLVFPIVAGKDYQGININHFGNDAHFYLSRGEDVLEGHALGNSLVKEWKNELDSYRAYSDHILLAPIKILSLADKVNIVSVYNFYNFIGVFFIILLIYLFVWQLSGNKLLSISTALFAIGGYSIVYFKTLFYSDFNVYARAIYPFISSFFFFLYLNLLWKAINSDGKKYKILSGLAFGLLFYIYFHAWSFVLAINGCLILIYLICKNFKAVKDVIFISLLGLALGFYNVLSLIASFGSEMEKLTAYFMRMSYGREIIFSKIGLVALLVFAVFFYFRRENKNAPFILAIILSGWMALNQQLVTGRILQYGHYYWYFIVPLSIILIFYMVWVLLRNETWRKIVFFLVLAIAIVNTAGGQYKSFFTTLEIKKYEQNFRPIIDYLNQDKAAGVILCGEQTEDLLLTIYTRHDLFWHSNVPAGYLPSVDRYKDALFVYLYLNKEGRNNFAEFLNKITSEKNLDNPEYLYLYQNLEGYWSGFDYYAYTKKIILGDSGLIERRPLVIDALSQEYEKTVLPHGGFLELLKKYGVNYIVWDKNKNPEWDLSVVSGLTQVLDSHNIFVYKLQ